MAGFSPFDPYGVQTQTLFNADPRVQFARQLMVNAATPTPVRSPLEGLAKMLTGALGGYMQRPIFDEYQARQQKANEYAQQLMGADDSSPIATDPATGQPAPTGAGPLVNASGPALPGMMDYAKAAMVDSIIPGAGTGMLKNRAELAIKLGVPPDEVRTIQATYPNDQQAQHAALAALAEKNGTLVLRPNTTAIGPHGPMTAPDPEHGREVAWGANGPQIQEMPGAALIPAQAGTIASAQAAAKAPYDFQMVTTGSGAQVPMSAAQLASGAVPGAPQKAVASLKTQDAPSDQLHDPWATMPTLEAPSGIGQSTYQHERQSQAAQIASKASEESQKQAETSNQRLSFNSQAIDALQKATTGPGALDIAGVKNFLTQRLGIPESVLNHISAGDVASTQELNKYLINAATQVAKQNYGSRITQSEVMLQINQAAPGIEMAPAAIKYLLTADSARAKYDIQKAADLGKYLQKGGDPYQFEGWYTQHFPQTAAVDQAIKAPELKAKDGRSVDDLIKFYGKK